MALGNAVEYTSGSDVDMPHIVRVPLNSKDTTHNNLVVKWIEFWCQINCESDWHLREYNNHVEIGFQSIDELVLFKLSPEFDS